MEIAFAIMAALTLVGAVAAMSMRNLVHCALCLAAAFVGLAAFYLQLGAAFVGWAQILVYVGAVAILIVFAILLTRSGESVSPRVVSKSQIAGIVVTLLVFGALAEAIMMSQLAGKEAPPMMSQPAGKETSVKLEPAVRDIGDQLMTRFVLPLEATGLLLTAAAIGAVIIAMRDKPAGASPKVETSKPNPHH